MFRIVGTVYSPIGHSSVRLVETPYPRGTALSVLRCLLPSIASSNISVTGGYPTKSVDNVEEFVLEIKMVDTPSGKIAMLRFSTSGGKWFRALYKDGELIVETNIRNIANFLKTLLHTVYTQLSRDIIVRNRWLNILEA